MISPTAFKQAASERVDGPYSFFWQKKERTKERKNKRGKVGSEEISSIVCRQQNFVSHIPSRGHTHSPAIYFIFFASVAVV